MTTTKGNEMFVHRVFRLLTDGETVTHPDEAREVLDALGVEYVPESLASVDSDEGLLWEAALDSGIPADYTDTDVVDLGDPDNEDEYTEDVIASIEVMPAILW